MRIEDPLTLAFSTALKTAYGPAALTTAIDAVFPHIVAARDLGVGYRHLAARLSAVSTDAGRPPITADTLRGLFRRLRRARAQDVLRPPAQPQPTRSASQKVDDAKGMTPAEPASLAMRAAQGTGPPTAPIVGGLSEQNRARAQARRELRRT